MYSDQHARGGVKLNGKDFFVFFWLYLKVWLDLMVQGVKLHVILMAELIFHLKNTV